MAPPAAPPRGEDEPQEEAHRVDLRPPGHRRSRTRVLDRRHRPGQAGIGEVHAVTVHQLSTVTGLAPGSQAHRLSGNFDNPNPGAVSVAAVTAEVTAVEAHGVEGTCSPEDFTIGGTGSVDVTVPTGDSKGGWSDLTISMRNTQVNQDACKNVQVVIAYTAVGTAAVS